MEHIPCKKNLQLTYWVCIHTSWISLSIYLAHQQRLSLTYIICVLAHDGIWESSEKYSFLRIALVKTDFFSISTETFNIV